MKMQVRVGALAYGGAFVADIIDGDPETPKKKVFIRDVAPGEVVEAQLVSEEKNLIHASLLQVVEPSPARITPPCPWFGACGGCDLQHLNIDTQRDAKREMVERALQFQGKLKPLRGVTLIEAALPAFHYRRRVSLHLSENGEIGFYRSGSGDVVDIEYCLLATDDLNAALKSIRPLLPVLCPHIGGITLEQSQNEVFCVLQLRKGSHLEGTAFELAKTKIANLIVEQNSKVLFIQHNFVAEKHPRFPAGHFSQVNESANQVLVAEVLQSIESTYVTELYAGAGNFSIPLAQRGTLVDAVEADPYLARHGKDLVASLGLTDKISIFETTCERYLQRTPPQEAILLDPPRSGAKTILKYFEPQKSKHIVYVSCSLPTLTRDLKELCAKGYTLESVKVLDMFSQTHHVETLSVLKA
ncbi:MAG: class I SAM-dependent RNA methyltransferase [Deltaproteobacteria bacterium]|nr:class I SAM-dependent RNA methyltransferase [Deltaproteobacteria bacterium]